MRVEGPVPRNTAGWDSGHKAAGAEQGVFATWRLSGVEWAVRPTEELFTEDEVLFGFSGVFSPSVSVSDSSWSLSSSSSSSSDPSVSDSELLSDSVSKKVWQKAHYDLETTDKYIEVLTPEKSFIIYAFIVTSLKHKQKVLINYLNFKITTNMTALSNSAWQYTILLHGKIWVTEAAIFQDCLPQNELQLNHPLLARQWPGTTPGRAFHGCEIHREEEENNRTGYGLKDVRIKSMANWAKEELESRTTRVRN